MCDFGCAEPTEMLCIKAFRWLSQIMTKSRISFRTQSVTAAPQDFRPFQVRRLMCVFFFLGCGRFNARRWQKFGDAAITVLSNFGLKK